MIVAWGPTGNRTVKARFCHRLPLTPVIFACRLGGLLSGDRTGDSGGDRVYFGGCSTLLKNLQCVSGYIEWLEHDPATL